MSQTIPSANHDLHAFLEGAAEKPWQRDFFFFLRELESYSPDRPRIGTSKRYRDDQVFLSQALFLECAPSSVKTIELSPNTSGSGPRARLEGYFLGLLGPSGPMPLSWTEYIVSRSSGVPHPDRITPALRGVSLNRRDSSLKDFVNIFNHRFLSFFYRAWASSRKCVDYDRPSEAKFVNFIGALIGLGSEDVQKRMDFGDGQAIYFSGHLADRTRHPSGLVSMMSDYLQCPVSLEENVGRWLPIPNESLSSLGQDSNAGKLGDGMAMGSRFWDRQLCFELKIGPLSLVEFQRFSTDSHEGDEISIIPALRDMVALYTNREFFCTAKIILDRNEVPKPTLGGGSRLGFSLWLHREAPENHPEELQVELS